MAKKKSPQEQKSVTSPVTKKSSADVKAATPEQKGITTYAIWILLGIVAAVYAKTIGFDFVNWDDEMYIALNQRIRGLDAEHLKMMFGIDDLSKAYYGGNYHPLVALSNAIEIAIFGDKPSVYHATNVVLHVLNTYLTYRFIYRFTKGNQLVALWVAGLFGLHPLHTESVAWISERKDVLYAFFYLLAMIAYLKYREGKKILQYVIVVLFFLLSLLSKSMAVTLPLILITIDYYLTKRENGKLGWDIVLNKIPLFALSLVFGLLAMKSQQAQGYIAENATVYSALQKILFPLYNIGYYIVSLILPIKQASLHPFPIPKEGSIPIQFYLYPLLLLPIVYGIWKSKKYKPLLIFGFLFYLFTISIVMQVIQIGSSVVSERYTYMAYTGLFFILAQWAYDIYTGELNILSSLKSKIPMIMSVIIGLFGILSFLRLDVWKNGLTMWEDNVKKYPETNHYAYYGYANALSNEKRYPEALEAYNKGISINPAFSSYYLNRSGTLNALNKKAEAIADLDMCLRLNNKSTQGYYNRGLYKTDMNRWAEAKADFDSALAIDPNYIECKFLRGMSKKNLGDFAGAIQDYEATIAQNPTFPNVHNNIANVYASMKDYNKAIQYYDQALQINPQDYNALVNKGVSYLNLNNKTAACAAFKTAADAGNAQGKDAYIHLCQ